MKKLNLNLYESCLPPTDVKVLWVDTDKLTGDIKCIYKHKNGQWEPYMVSVNYMSPNNSERIDEQS